VKSTTITVEGMGVKGAKMDLVIGVLCEGSDGTWAGMLRRPNKPFKACLRHAFVTASQFAQVVFTTAIKTTRGL
jgi:hypothetical protein